MGRQRKRVRETNIDREICSSLDGRIGCLVSGWPSSKCLIKTGHASIVSAASSR